MPNPEFPPLPPEGAPGGAPLSFAALDAVGHQIRSIAPYFSSESVTRAIGRVRDGQDIASAVASERSRITENEQRRLAHSQLSQTIAMTDPDLHRSDSLARMYEDHDRGLTVAECVLRERNRIAAGQVASPEDLFGAGLCPPSPICEPCERHRTERAARHNRVIAYQSAVERPQPRVLNRFERAKLVAIKLRSFGATLRAFKRHRRALIATRGALPAADRAPLRAKLKRMNDAFIRLSDYYVLNHYNGASARVRAHRNVQRVLCRCNQCECETCNPEGMRCDECACEYCYEYDRRDCGECSCRICYPDGRDCACCDCTTCYPDGRNCDECSCRDCYPDGRDCSDRSCEYCHGRSENLHDYSYKPRPLFFDALKSGEINSRSPKPGERYFGIEVECEAQDDSEDRDVAVEQVESLEGSRYYCKEDGSLDCGIEVVSHPTTFRAWCARGPDLAWAEYLRKDHYKSYNTTTCGMHVHVSRSALPPSAIAKLLILFRNNAPTIARWSRRRSEKLAMWARIEEDPTAVFIAKVKGESDDRRVAINLCNSNTVEFRLFRGTLASRSILGNIGLVEALVSFARKATKTELTMDGFLAHVTRESVAKDRTEPERRVLSYVRQWIGAPEPKVRPRAPAVIETADESLDDAVLAPATNINGES